MTTKINQPEFPIVGAPIVPAAPISVTPMDLIKIAMDKDADIGKLESLLNLQLRWEANEAKKAFVSAMNAFKADPPEIVKNRKASFGNTAYDYATLDQVCRQITSSLSKHDISHRWKVEQSDGLIRVTCILTHSMGHSEETTMVGASDTSGSKNAIQAIGSAVTYLERYSLLAATGLAAKNGDSDGVALTPELEAAITAIREAPDTTALKKVSSESIQAYMKAKDLAAARALMEAREERKKELTSEEPA